MKFLLAIFFVPILGNAEVLTKVSCNYRMMGIAMGTSELNLHADETPESSALVSIGPGTPPKSFSVTPEVVAEGEMAHVWISKEEPNGAIEMITYKVPQTDGTQGKLINKNVPIGQEMSGPCTFTSTEVKSHGWD